MNLGIVIAAMDNHKERLAIATRMAERMDATVYSVKMEKPVKADICFDKFRLVSEALSAHDFIMWLDSDCCVLRPEFNLEVALRIWGTPSTNVWTALDWNGICGCVYVFRRCEWTFKFLAAMQLLGITQDQTGQWDQGTIKQAVKQNPSVAWHIRSLPSEVVTDQTLKPIPMPFIWHLLMGPNTASYMEDVEQAVLAGRFAAYASGWKETPHGVRYE